MTPQEKAKELVEKFDRLDFAEQWEPFNHNARECALIAVELRLEGTFNFTSIQYGEASSEYWEQVKEEINKL